MATVLNGVNYEVGDSEVDFFGSKGMKLSSGKWAVNVGGDLWVETSPDSMMGDVRSCFASDKAAGNGDRIAQLQLSPRSAVVFFLEGMMTRAHLENAVETSEYIDIPGVKVDGITLTVRILQDAAYLYATADADGVIL